MKKDQIELDILTERPIVRDDATSELDVVIEIRSNQSADELDQNKALNLCIVIDRSGSMEGNQLETAKKSCIDIFNQLDEKDLFTVVVFDEEAEVVVNPQVPKAEVIEKINKIKTGGSTNLSLGWYLGLLELQTYMTENHNNRLFLLSDGYANEGETKITALTQEASQSRELGITTSTIGIGEDFQEDILNAIATESGGRFWYIQESQIRDIIDEEFKGALSVIIDRPRIELKLPVGVRVSQELNNLSMFANKYRVRPIKGEDLFNFAVRLEINSKKIEGDNFTLEATLFDGEETIVETQRKVLLKSNRQVVSSQANPIVQSVVAQFRKTSIGESKKKQILEGNLTLMKKMIVENVGGMRKVRDALLKEEKSTRIVGEIEYLEREIFEEERSLLISEMLEGFQNNQEVMNFMMRWGKLTESSSSSSSYREYKSSDYEQEYYEELEVNFLESAIDLADTLIDKFPDKKDHLVDYQRKIREKLARYK